MGVSGMCVSLRVSCAMVALVAAAGSAAPAGAETLAEAFAQAYQYNPQLLAQRAQLRATDESVPQALAGWRPTVQFTGSAGKEISQTTQSVNNVGTRTTLAQAFLDVVRDQATVQLNINNEQVLRRQLEATNDRFRVGEVTRTDVAQSESRVALAVATRVQAEGNLQVSRSNYQRAVGHLPDRLAQPTERVNLPATRDEALALARAQNPNVIRTRR